ncbi:MAG: peptidoglycan-binding domain-containing protein [Betaproteobacteria bacterium]
MSAPAPTQAAITDSNKVTVSCSEPSATRAGQCFTRVVYPAQYRDDQTQTIVRPAYEKITYTDPVYEDVQEQVLQRESYTREVELPALYDTFYEQTLVTPAGKVWKPGHGKVERVDPNTGEVFCLVDQPAVYNTVEKKQLKRPASKRVDVVPAGYSTVTVHRLVKAPEQVKTQIPAEYGVVDKQVRTGADSCEYVQVLCEDNATSAKISEVQAALTAKGYDTEATGAVNEDLTDSLKEFQSDQDLPETGLMTARTLDALGVALEIDPNAAIVAPNTQDATRPDASSRNMPSQNTSANPQRQ